MRKALLRAVVTAVVTAVGFAVYRKVAPAKQTTQPWAAATDQV